jgi:hypothetical protein
MSWTVVYVFFTKLGPASVRFVKNRLAESNLYDGRSTRLRSFYISGASLVKKKKKHNRCQKAIIRALCFVNPVPVAVRYKAWVCSRSRFRISMRAWILVRWHFIMCCAGNGFLSFVQKIHTRYVCLTVSDLETLTMRRPRPDLGCCATEEE